MAGGNNTPPGDRIIEETEFSIGGGVDLSAFMVNEDEPSSPKSTQDELAETSQSVEDEKDEALGSVVTPFVKGSKPQPGDIARDGSVSTEPEPDSVTQLATEGEQRLHWGLMVGMVIIYSALGFVAGLTLPPIAGFIGLLGMAALGFWWVEVWAPRPAMRLLGITWAIIAMKVLYGLTIDLYYWGWLEWTGSPEWTLATVLLLLVVLNIWLARRHDSDAIAAQATLVLLAIASGTGSLGGEIGVAVMIGLATILFHGLALNRGSGNLASLGIAASNLWVGFHALSDGWKIGNFIIIPFSEPLVLFLLVMVISGMNAAMATRFAKGENWFSDGLSKVGLGKPGLWSVSVGLGMVGAMMAVAAHRGETGYALGLVTILLASFGASYLAVRGVKSSVLLPPLLGGIPGLLVLLLLPALLGGDDVSEARAALLGAVVALVGIGWGVKSSKAQRLLASSPILIYFILLFPAVTQWFTETVSPSVWELFTVVGVWLTVWSILRHQQAVSDHVLWLGSLILMVLLSLLVPAAEGEGGGPLLLASLSIIHLGTGFLAVHRSSPGLAGVTILSPWIWLVILGLDIEGRLLSESVVPISLVGWHLGAYLLLVTFLQLPVNRSMGGTGVNLAAQAFGLSELGGYLRDSGIMVLWNIGYLAALVGWLAAAGLLPGGAVAAGMALLLLIHIFAESRGLHQGNPRFLLVAFGLSALWLQWRYGMAPAWSILVLAGGLGLLYSNRISKPERLLTITMGLLSAFSILWYLEVSSLVQIPESLLGDAWWFTQSQTGWVLILISALMMGVYLPKAARLEELLQPAGTSLLLLMVTMLVGSEVDWGFFASLSLFVASGAWLAAQGEIRSGLRSVARREERLAQFGVSQQPPPAHKPSTQTADTPYDLPEGLAPVGEVGVVDADLIRLHEKQQKRRKRAGSTGEMDLLVGDIHHRPVVVLTFITGALLFGFLTSYSGGGAVARGTLLLVGLISLLFIWLARWRAGTLKLPLPDLLGVELPIVATMLGIVLVFLSGRLTIGPIDTSDVLDVAILSTLLLILAGVSLMGRTDLALRIPSALEWLIWSMLAARLIASLFGTLPPPLTLDLLGGGSDFITWHLPWGFTEVVLIGAVLGWDMIERQRLRRGMGDIRGAPGRLLWLLSLVLLSCGPAALLAAIFSSLRGRSWKQPAVVGGALLFFIGGWHSLSVWLLGIENTTGWLGVFASLLLIGGVAFTVRRAWVPWTTVWIWDLHLILPFSVIAIRGHIDEWSVIALLSISLTTWVAGIIEDRKSVRIFGAIDLVIAWVLAALTVRVDDTPSILFLAMLVASAVVLGIVTWLGQRYHDRLTTD